MVIAIICDKKIRYDRLATREFRTLTNEEASNRDVSEIENLAKGGPIAYADYYINNNGSVEEYYQRLNEILITEHGEIHEKPMGIISVSDLPSIYNIINHNLL